MGFNAAILNRITVSECSNLSETEIQLRELPQDPYSNHAYEIAQKLKTGVATTYKLLKDGRYIGFFVAEIYNREYVILAMRCFEVADVVETLLPTVERIAREKECDSITFHTVRAGLISKTLESGFHVSSVVMRKPL